MHIQVIVEQEPDNAAHEISRLNGVMIQLGYEGRTVFAEAYGTEGLVQILEVRASTGQGEILVMGCSREQIQAVLEWQSCHDEGEFEDLVIHLVRKA
ncbi:MULTISPECIES: hypothetical protein [unclassified Pseudomonas]|uniref:hypothetical protein n=1 Tax=unclassified Pseudomonas TaxID=196821 RepID=UPI000919BD9B|nr:MULTISPECIES: hypothetical protein [unclassified Pseudomonas]SFX93011.1 hypothetical protein SAMN03159352_02582 [Pseudomonas sp. NFACC43]SFY29605.1 hypothetical protein SAMN03159442_05217 [Pseudomonas sp. NFACC47-1]